MRRVPLRMARALGRATRRSKLVPPIYIAVVFFLLPIVLLLISSCFEKKSIGFTVLGSFIVIFFLLAAIRFGVWWKYQDGQTKCLAMLDKRTDMSECKKTLPEDMKSLKKNMELVKSKVLEICEHTGVPAEFDEAEEPAELKQLDNDEGEEGTDESDGPAKPDDVDGHNVKESIMSA
jgi:sodium-dependent phosphate cotransporter